MMKSFEQQTYLDEKSHLRRMEKGEQGDVIVKTKCGKDRGKKKQALKSML